MAQDSLERKEERSDEMIQSAVDLWLDCKHRCAEGQRTSWDNKLGRYSASHTLLKYMKKWGVRRRIYSIVRPYWGTSALKGKDKRTKGDKECENNLWANQNRSGSWERMNQWKTKASGAVGKWISWHHKMSQRMSKRVGHTALMKRWNRGKGAVCDGMEQGEWQRTWEISKNKPTTQ